MFTPAGCCSSKRKPYGFRISLSDIIVIVIGISAGILLAREYPLFSHAIFLVLGHFFLFCNVFLVGRKPEYCWAVWFVTSVVLLFFLDCYSLARLLLVILPASAGVIGYAVTRKHYRGIFCSVKSLTAEKDG